MKPERFASIDPIIRNEDPGVQIRRDEIVRKKMGDARAYLERNGWTLMPSTDRRFARVWQNRVADARYLDGWRYDFNRSMSWEERLSAQVFDACEHALQASADGDIDEAMGCAWLAGFWAAHSAISLKIAKARRPGGRKKLRVPDDEYRKAAALFTSRSERRPMTCAEVKGMLPPAILNAVKDKTHDNRISILKLLDRA